MLKLRPYQEKIISDSLESLKLTKKCLIVLPTGSGKTIVFSSIVQRLGLKTLVIAHTKELIQQIKEKIKDIVADPFLVKICTIQSTVSKKNIQNLIDEQFELLIVDECHRSAANSYNNLIKRLGFEKKLIIGVTATPFRTDLKDIKEIFGHSVCTVSMFELINDKYLSDFIGFRIQTNVSLKKIRKQRGDFNNSQLDAVVNVKNRNELIVENYKKICFDEKAIAFCASVKHAYALKKVFNKHGISCEVIEGNMNDNIRKSNLDKFSCGKTKVLANYQILTEGFDSPDVMVLLMCRPTCSKLLYIQMIGRGARVTSNKNICKVLEFTDNDYDVCSLEDLIDIPIKKYRFKDGEKLSEYKIRGIIEEEEVSGQSSVISSLKILPRSLHEKPASVWQLKKLKELRIKFVHPINEYTANHLIFKAL